ncbi:ribonuclease HII [Roseovarius salinarum]|uniref:ribonuclease HII n=1 Tax=Roseovarius salinarum TaxID=1981892 RepID=UPI000C320FB8|nr:ribonuclease HII [Roseovarius salinarum]
MAGPDYTLETEHLFHGAVCGVDEVGRGPLAGPVTAAAVVLNPDDVPEGLNDSKRLTGPRRAALTEALMARASVCVAHASVAEIDSLNILRASQLAMVRAVAGLHPRPGFALIDGNLIPENLGVPARAVVRGDAASLSIAAASIVAKTCRDGIMRELARECPGYGWETNAGYPSAAHRAALQDLGVTPHHRRSFKPVHNILYQEKSVTP